MRSLVSVIIPVYNADNYIRCCLDSILAQTYEELEIILVDDGSSDSSPEICDEYAKKDFRIKVFHQKNAGPAAARNTGIDHMHGDYVIFVDADDYIHREYIGQLMRPCLEQGAEVTIGKDVLFYPDEEKEDFVQCELPSAQITCMTGRDVNYRLFTGEDVRATVYMTDKMIRADLLADIRIPDWRVYEDRAFTYKFLYPLKKVAYTDSALYFRRINPTSIMHSKFTDDFFSILGILDEQIQFYLEHNEHKLAAQAAEFLCWSTMDCYDKTVRTGEEIKKRKRILRNAAMRLCKKSFSIKGIRFKRRVKYILALLIPGVICPLCHPSKSLYVFKSGQ